MQDPRWNFAAAFFVAISLGSAAIAWAESKPDAIDLARLKCVGNTTFATDKIIVGLGGDLEWAGAESGRMPPSARLKLLEERVARGYANAGFHEAEVVAERDADSGQTTLRIVEGPRCLMGEVRIEGAGPIPVERLVECLTQPTAGAGAVRSAFREVNGVTTPLWFDKDDKPIKSVSPVWVKGKPLRLERNTRRAARPVVRQALDDLGYRSAQFDVAVEREAMSQTSVFVIKLSEVGAPSTVARIEITGLNKNSREDLLAFLGLREGMLFTRAEQLRIEQSLWRSARFLHCAVKLSDKTASGGAGQLRIELEECEFAPPLAQPLSPEETALVKLRDWLATFSQRDLDATLDVRAPKSTARVVISPRHGAVLRFKSEGRLLDQFSLAPRDWLPALPALASLVGQLAAPPASSGLDQGLVVTDEQIGFYNLKQGHQFIGAPILATGSFSFEAAPLRVADRKGPGSNRFNFGVGFHSHDADDDDNNEPRPPIELTLQLSPVSFVMEAHRQQVILELADGVLSYRSAGVLIRSRAETGECLECAFDGGANNAHWRVTFEPGAYAEQIAELKQLSAGHPNLLDDQHWATSLAKYLVTDEMLPNLLGIGRFDPRVVSLITKGLGNNVLAPIDRLRRLPSDTPDDFPIPPDLTDPPPTFTQSLAVSLYPYGHRVLANHSWPSDLWRLAALLAAGKQAEARQEVTNYFDDDDHGPLAFMAACRLSQLAQVGQERRCAMRAQARLSTAAFRRDCSALWGGSSALGETIENLSKTLAALDENEATLVCQQLPKPWAAVARDFAATLRKHREAPPLDALEAAAAEVWESTLRERAGDYLWSMMSKSP